MLSSVVSLDIAKMFIPTVSFLEIFVRGTIVYLVIFSLLRFFLKRVAGAFAITDLLMIVLIADAAQNAMASDYTSLTDGLLLVATIIFWNFMLNWLSFHIPSVQKFIRLPPLPLVKDGNFLRRNMRQELITEDELWGEIRKQGVEHMHEVKLAFMEGDGSISVIKKE